MKLVLEELLIRKDIPENAKENLKRAIDERNKAESKLKESEDLFKSIFDDSPIGIELYDSKGELLLINKACLDIFGIENPEETKQFSLFEDPNIVNDIKEKLYNDENVKCKTVFDFEKVKEHKLYQTTKSGIHNFEVVITLLGAKGSRKGYLVQVQDITDRKLAEEKYCTIVKTSLDGFWINDVQGRIIDVNDSFCNMVGYTREELLKMSITDLEVIENSEETAAHIKKAIKSGYDRFETCQRCKDGKIIYVEISGTYSEEFGGKFIVFLRNITARKKAEKELLNKTTLLEAQSETMFDGILVVNDEGKSILFNKRFREMWNIPADILENRDDNEMLNYIRNQLKNPDKFIDKVRYLYHHKDVKSIDEIEFKDGKYFDRRSAPLTDLNGEYHGRIWYFRDITERKLAENAIKKARDDYLAITNLTGEIIVHIDKEGRWTFLNDGACQFWGKSKEELIGCAFVDYLHPDDQEETTIAVQKMIERKKILKDHVNRQKTAEGWRTVEWNSYPLFDKSGNYAGLQATGRDITERMLKEEQIRKAQKMLQKEKKNLEETNIALDILLKHQDKEKREIEKNIITNFNTLVSPYLKKLENMIIDSHQKTLIRIIIKNCSEIVKPFERKLFKEGISLSPPEINVAKLTKDDKTAKEIAEILYISVHTVKAHKRHIRKKLQINSKKVNLKSHLQSLFE